jgi:hypothetical protein
MAGPKFICRRQAPITPDELMIGCTVDPFLIVKIDFYKRITPYVSRRFEQRDNYTPQRPNAISPELFPL